MSPEIVAEIEAEDALYDAPPAPKVAPPSADPVEDLPRRGIDESVLAVLREEADRETAARRGETPQTIETQTEMGLTAQAAAASAAAQRIARMKGVEASVAPPAPVRPQSRRDMLPEIEEINSSLRASSEKRTGVAAVVSDSMGAEKATGGFRTGFVLMLLLAIVMVVVYIMAPKIAQQIPGAAGAMEAYVGFIDSLRHTVDGLTRSAIGWLRGAAGGGA